MNTRFVLVCRGRDGNIVLMEPAQGRYTYSTAEEAYAKLRDIKSSNSESQLVSVFGSQSLGTMGVRRVECWPGHNDPVATVYGEA